MKLTVATSESPHKSNDVYENVSDGYDGSLHWDVEGYHTIIMAYVTELGFYVFYIDCHHVTLTDRKKVVKSMASLRGSLECKSKWTHDPRALHSNPRIRLNFNPRLSRKTLNHKHRMLRDRYSIEWNNWATNWRVDLVELVAQVASSRKKTIKFGLMFGINRNLFI